MLDGVNHVQMNAARTALNSAVVYKIESAIGGAPEEHYDKVSKTVCAVWFLLYTTYTIDRHDYSITVQNQNHGTATCINFFICITCEQSF